MIHTTYITEQER